MKKILLLLNLIFFTFFSVTAQKNTFDSLFLYNEIKLTDAHIQNYKWLDSIQTDALKKIITDRLKNNKPVEFDLAFCNLHSFASHNIDTEEKNKYKNTLEYTDFLLRNYDFNEKYKLELLRAKYHFNRLIESSSEQFLILSEVLKKIMKIEKEEKAKLELQYYVDCYEQANYLEYLHLPSQAEDMLARILYVEFWKFEESTSYREIINMQEAAALGLLNLRRGNLKLLEATHLEVSDNVKAIHKGYIEELGGVYPPLSWYAKDEPTEIIKIKEH